jgi:hypothetical protein
VVERRPIGCDVTSAYARGHLDATVLLVADLGQFDGLE